MSCRVDFPGTSHPAASVPHGTNLSQLLDVTNSPLLFGCRTGICGTCLVQIERGYEDLTPPCSEELEALDVYAPGNSQARLACQINLNADIALRKITSE